MTTQETVEKLDDELRTTNGTLEAKTKECQENLERAEKAEAEQKKIQELYNKCQDTVKSQAESINELTRDAKLLRIDLQHSREQARGLSMALGRQDSLIPSGVVVDTELVNVLKSSIVERDVSLDMAQSEISRLQLQLLQRAECSINNSPSPLQPPISMRAMSHSPIPPSPQDTHPGHRYVSAFLRGGISGHESPTRHHLLSPPSVLH